MTWIAGGKMAGNSKGGYIFANAGNGGGQCVFVQWGLLATIRLMSTFNEKDRILTKSAGKISAFKCGFVKADHNQADTPADTFNNSVGGQCCR